MSYIVKTEITFEAMEKMATYFARRLGLLSLFCGAYFSLLGCSVTDQGKATIFLGELTSAKLYD